MVISGVSAAVLNKTLVKKVAEQVENLKPTVLPVVNDFFGATVTCTGLLTGKDILAAVENYKKGGGEFDEIVLAGNTLKEFEDVFLCGMRLSELKRKLKCKKIRINRNGGYGFVEILSTEK